MIFKTDLTSPAGGQAGESIYSYFKITSVQSGLNGWGLYLEGEHEPVYWSEDDEMITIFYKNLESRIPNEDVTIRIFVNYVRDTHQAGRRYVFNDARSSRAYI